MDELDVIKILDSSSVYLEHLSKYLQQTKTKSIQMKIFSQPNYSYTMVMVQNKSNKQTKKKLDIFTVKRTVNLIPNDRPRKNCNVRFTTVLLKPISDQ